MPTVTLYQPVANVVLTPGQSLHVAGRTIGTGGAEPDSVDTVTVSVDGGAPKEAHVKVVPKQKVPTATFSVDVTAPTDGGLHTVRAVAAFGSGVHATASVAVVVQAPSTSEFTPRESLLVSVTNPGAPSAGDWAGDLVRAHPSPSGLLPSLLDLAVWRKRGDDYPACAREWVQALAPTEDVDADTVGFSGWLLQPEMSGSDVPFTHPFGTDWECMVALDPDFAGLLAEGNSVPDGTDGAQAIADAARLQIPVPEGGLLAVETDGGAVPSALKRFGDQVRVGDRIAVFGRWIADAGHHVDVASGTSYRAEVHPPLLMAVGGTRSTPDGDLTRILVT